MSETQDPRIPSPETFVRLRRKAMAQGERDLLARMGASSAEEAIQFFNEHKRGSAAKPAPKGDEGTTAPAPKKEPGESQGDYLERLSKLLDERLAPINKRFEEHDAAEKRRGEEAAAAKKAAEDAAAQKKAYQQEVAWLQDLAVDYGALDDEKKLGRLTKYYEAAIADLSDEDVEKLFGEGVPEHKRKKNAQKILDGIREDSPGLFKKVEDARADAKPEGGAAATVKPEAKPDGKPAAEPKKPANTGASSDPGAAARPGAKPEGQQKLDTTKLSPKQFQQFKSNPAAFRKLWEAGEITYEQPKRA